MTFGFRLSGQVLLPITMGMALILGGCTTTEPVQQQPVNQSTPQTQTPTRSGAPNLGQLTYQNAEFHLIVNRTTMSDVQRWWGPAHGRGHSGEFLFLNYTDVLHDNERSRMLMMTLYFSPQGVLQDYDLQIHEFAK
ncbi:hypothetical protein FM042_02125 [Aliidiomarina halalkaliphila]|uniref:Lipoprotein n=1 Tax=Aliidiomarina halalkaliphila TaxID=2593535 RepID=A0A552X3T4_9GAMM|nr:hypothetical protein [Aliidiomarina halalkaliphila]TRW49681.1 hypothetical protein FM042_02125 [Aliidiomarina halalkaliphila]